MSNWIEQDANRMRHELENIYMLAQQKRVVVYRYPPGWEIEGPMQVGPKSDDPDWDHIIRFCEQAGLRPTVLRSLSTTQRVGSGVAPDLAVTEESHGAVSS